MSDSQTPLSSATLKLPPRQTDQQQQQSAQPSGSDAFLLAVKQIDLQKDLANLPSMPCSRQSLLLGIGGGSAVGAIRFISSRNAVGSSRWAVAAFAVLSLTSWEICKRANAAEQAKMRAAVQDYRSKAKAKAEKQGSPGKISAPGGILVGEKGKEMLEAQAHQNPSMQDSQRLV